MKRKGEKGHFHKVLSGLLVSFPLENDTTTLSEMTGRKGITRITEMRAR